jgi:hypothetical protein
MRKWDANADNLNSGQVTEALLLERIVISIPIATKVNVKESQLTLYPAGIHLPLETSAAVFSSISG